VDAPVAAAAPVHQVVEVAAPAAAAVAAAPAVTAAYTAPEVITPQVQYAYLPYAQNYGYQTAPSTHVVAAPSTPVSYVSQPAPVAYSAAPVHVAPVAPQASQYHAQDDFGQYNFGYNDGNSVKQEVRTADGVVRGAYSYVDSDGIVQNVNYIADALGFRVGATNLPVHNVAADVAPAVVDAPAVAPVAVAAAAPVAVHSAAQVLAPAHQNYAYLPYATNYGYSNYNTHTVAAAPLVAAAPVATAPVAAAPVATAPVAVAPVAVATSAAIHGTNSQFHAQDDAGQYNYGFSSPDQTKQEVKTADGVTRGSYSYVDANGLVQTVNYISDLMGFRVAATNLPVHHVEGNALEAAAPAVAYAQNYGYAAAAAA